MARKRNDPDAGYINEDLEWEKLEQLKRRDHFVTLTANGELIPAKHLLETDGISLSQDFMIGFAMGYKFGLFTDCPSISNFSDFRDEVRIVAAQALRKALNAACSEPTFVPLTMMVYMQLHNHYKTYLSRKYFEAYGDIDMAVCSSGLFGVTSGEVLFEEYDIGPNRMYIDRLEGLEDPAGSFVLTQKHSEKQVMLLSTDATVKKDNSICLFLECLNKSISGYLDVVMASGL